MTKVELLIDESGNEVWVGNYSILEFETDENIREDDFVMFDDKGKIEINVEYNKPLYYKNHLRHNKENMGNKLQKVCGMAISNSANGKVKVFIGGIYDYFDYKDLIIKKLNENNKA